MRSLATRCHQNLHCWAFEQRSFPAAHLPATLFGKALNYSPVQMDLSTFLFIAHLYFSLSRQMKSCQAQAIDPTRARVCVCGVQGSEQSAADAGLGHGGGHSGSQEPETLRRGARCQLVRALPQLPAGEAAGALPHAHLHTRAGQICTGKAHSGATAQSDLSRAYVTLLLRGCPFRVKQAHD